ncbi:MAG: DUF222 domain-containing protein [Nitriliruptoraceae bacterium]
MGADVPRDALALLDVLERAVGSVCGIEVDTVDEAGLTARLDRLQRAQARLAAERARLVAVLEQRRTAPIQDPRQRERERQQLRREVAGRSNRAPAATKLDAQAGRAAAEHTATGVAFADGHLDAEHVRLIGQALDTIVDPDERATIEQDLLQVAGRSRPAVLGRYVRDLLARRVPVTVTLREEQQHRDRRFSATQTPDGGLALSGIVYGTAAETIRTALDAYRRADATGELRTPAQRSLDALEQLCAVALEAGVAPARHGTRPQVIVTVTTDQLDRGDHGVALLGSGEPTTIGRIRHLFDDCAWSRIILAPDSTPIEASETVRTVPHGLWRALLARDRGCTWHGCDAPAVGRHGLWRCRGGIATWSVSSRGVVAMGDGIGESVLSVNVVDPRDVVSVRGSWADCSSRCRSYSCLMSPSMSGWERAAGWRCRGRRRVRRAGM